jgi:hypothetical protein
MVKKIAAVLLFLGVALVGVQHALADVYVRGYFRANGSYVQPHYRSNPDGNFYNNWSTYPNVNPYTGQMGTRMSPPTYTPRMIYPSATYWKPPTYQTKTYWPK